MSSKERREARKKGELKCFYFISMLYYSVVDRVEIRLD